MFSKTVLRSFLAIVFMFSFTAMADTQPELEKTAVSLKGVDRLYVRVSDLDPELRELLSKESISEAVLRSEIERKLESAGIKTEPEELFRKTGKEDYLFLKIEIANIELKNEYIKIADSTKLPPKKFLFRLRLEFRQEVALNRNTDIKTMATTWMKDDFGYRRLNVIHDKVLSLTDIFVQEFLAVNR